MGPRGVGAPGRLHVLHCGGDRSPRGIGDPLGPDPGRLVYSPALAFLIQHPKANVLFDTGYHQRWSDTGFATGVGLAEFGIELTPADHIVVRLAEIGFAPGDVDVVVMSHLHADHAGGLEHFTHASVVVQRSERVFAAAPPVYQRALYDSRDFDQGLSWREVDGDFDLFDDERVVLLATPGHTPGHQSALVSLASETLLLAGDVAYRLDAIRAGRLSGVIWSADATLASWERLAELERARSARILLTHDPDFARTTKLPPAWYA